MENSKILLDHAIYALSSTSIASNQWSIGGGTVLANYFNHRISKDIDVFINDAQCLTELSPRVNDECDNALDCVIKIKLNFISNLLIQVLKNSVWQTRKVHYTLFL